jgi:hypothetical protein
MTDEPTAPTPGDDLPGMPAPPPLDGPSEPATPDAKGPSRAWIWIAAAVVVALVAGLAVVSLTGGDDTPGSADDNHFSDHGVSFDYPSDWQDFGPASFQVNSGDVQWSESFGAQAGSNGAIVTEYALKKDVSSVSEAALQAELDRLFTSTVDQAGGQLTQPLSQTTVNGMPGYQVSFTSTTGGVDLTTDMVLVFQGNQQWNIQCQYAAADQQDVRPGCQQIWDTFTIEG